MCVALHSVLSILIRLCAYCSGAITACGWSPGGGELISVGKDKQVGVRPLQGIHRARTAPYLPLVASRLYFCRGVERGGDELYVRSAFVFPILIRRFKRSS